MIEKLFCMNLSAPFLCQFFKDQMLKIMPYCDFVFGNETEAAAFAENNDIEDKSIENIARCIAALPKINSNPRTVVITQVRNYRKSKSFRTLIPRALIKQSLSRAVTSKLSPSPKLTASSIPMALAMLSSLDFYHSSSTRKV